MANTDTCPDCGEMILACICEHVNTFPECPSCGGDLQSLGTLGNLEHYRCRHCGTTWDDSDPEPSDGFLSDLVIVELKSVEEVAPVHKKQLLTYLRLSYKRLGLLINFGEARIKNGISRVVNGLPD